MNKSTPYDGGKPSACRFCSQPLTTTFVDLGMSPLCETFIKPESLNAMERFYPLHVYLCDSCYLVQLDEYVAPDEIFSSEYPYFSSYSTSWVEHARRYVDDVSSRFHIDRNSLVAEIASNDGYLLQHFAKHGVPVLGIEPAANVAAVARDKGVNTEEVFFGIKSARSLMRRYGRADLIVGNNVLAHVPDIRDFVGGMRLLLKEGGTITMEFPHLMHLIRENQFDTIYHEHFSYLSLFTVIEIFGAFGLVVFDVEEIPTHGGSLRIYARHSGFDALPVSNRVAELAAIEERFGLRDRETYLAYAGKVWETKRQILEFLIREKRNGKAIVGYGAPGKGNTLLNYCGIRTDFLDYTVDRNPHKHGTFTPGTRIPILPTETIFETKPDYLFILPWNLKDEIIEQTSAIRDWGGRWVVPIPSLTTVS